MAPPAIVARDLTKTFPRKPERGVWAAAKRLARREPAAPETLAVDGVSLEVERGELFGLLGPNGAGKTTLVKLLCTLLLPTSGTATVAGLDVEEEPEAVRRRVGVVLGGERALYWRLTARENLWYFSQLYDMPSALAKERIGTLLGLVGLAQRADERVENYSKGMKQRLHIARGLLNDPEVLLLDEPTIGLDAHAARTLRALVRRLVDEEGKTIVLTTHYLYEADELSDRVAILAKGRIVAVGTPGSLKRRLEGERAFRVDVERPPPGLDRRLSAVAGGAKVAGIALTGSPGRDAISYRVFAAPGEDSLPSALAAEVQAAGGRLLALRAEEPSLEDVFVKLTGEGLGEERGGGDDDA